jgi:hypothetical protein
MQSLGRLRVIAIVILPLFSSGCYMGLVKPHAERFDQMQDAIISSSTKVAYTTWSLQRPPPEMFSGIPVEIEDLQAGLADVLDEHGTEKYGPVLGFKKDHLNLAVYALEPAPTLLTRFVEFPMAMISIFSLGILPCRTQYTYPLEIEIVDTQKTGDDRLKIVRAEYSIVTWGWLPFLLHRQGETARGGFFFKHGKDSADISKKLIALGLREELRRALGESIVPQ